MLGCCAGWVGVEWFWWVRGVVRWVVLFTWCWVIGCRVGCRVAGWSSATVVFSTLSLSIFGEVLSHGFTQSARDLACPSSAHCFSHLPQRRSMSRGRTHLTKPSRAFRLACEAVEKKMYGSCLTCLIDHAWIAQHGTNACQVGLCLHISGCHLVFVAFSLWTCPPSLFPLFFFHARWDDPATVARQTSTSNIKK